MESMIEVSLGTGKKRSRKDQTVGPLYLVLDYPHARNFDLIRIELKIRPSTCPGIAGHMHRVCFLRGSTRASGGECLGKRASTTLFIPVPVCEVYV